MKKKLLALLTTISIVASVLAGCGANTSKDTVSSVETAETEPVSEAEEEAMTEEASVAQTAGDTFKIGYNYFGTGAYALAALANQSQVVLDIFGDESVASDDQFSVDQIIADIENMIAAGCDGLIIWLPSDALYETAAQMCQDAGVYFVLNDKVPSSESIKEKLLSNPYFAGACAPANSAYGELIAEYALAQGWKTCITTASAEGDASDQPRLDAFVETFEAGGGTILNNIHSDRAADSLTNVQNALIVSDEPDFIYGISSEFAMYACTALEGYPDYETKVVTSGLDSVALEALIDETSPVTMVNGDDWISGFFSAIMLRNACAGNILKDTDGNVIFIEDIMPFEVSPMAYELYQKYFLNESIYTQEEVMDMMGISYDGMLDIINQYNLENRLVAKYEMGIISAEEMEAAGISVD